MKRSSVAIRGVLTQERLTEGETGLPARPSDAALIGRRIG